MKVTLHFPTEQYGFVEVETEADTVLDALQLYKERMYTGEGLDPKTFNGVVDKMLLGESVEDGVNLYEKMSLFQQDVTQVIKRSLKRIDNKMK